MRRLLSIAAILLAVLALAACGDAAQTAKRIPTEIRAEAEQVVDEVMAGDLSAMREAFPDETSAEFEDFLERSMDAVREGDERARNLVGAQVLRGGNNLGYRIAHEVETEAGFTRISQTWGGEVGEAPILRQLEVEGSDDSLAARQRRLGMASRLVMLAFLLGIILMAATFIRLRRRPAS